MRFWNSPRGPRGPPGPPGPRKWCQERRLRPHLLRTPGARMTAVTQTPSNYSGTLTAHQGLEYRCRRSLMLYRAWEASFKWVRLPWPTAPASLLHPKYPITLSYIDMYIYIYMEACRRGLNGNQFQSMVCNGAPGVYFGSSDWVS